MKKIINLIFLSLLLCGSTAAQRLPEFEKAREIKLLERNRDDVRRIFAEYKLEKSEYEYNRETFSTVNADIDVSYSRGKCESDESEGFDVAEWIVDRIYIEPKNSIKESEVEKYLTKYRKEKIYNNEPKEFLFYNKSSGIIIRTDMGKIEAITFDPPEKYDSILCDKKIAKILSKSKSIFTKPLKERIKLFPELGGIPDVINLILSYSEVIVRCLNSSTHCSDRIDKLAVFAVGKDPENDVLTYTYKVSGGKIIGEGAKVVWDLSGVKPGTYTITAAVDDGCGFCGKSMKKTVIVKQCSDCLDK
jgi:hypothetical protein